MSLVTLSTVRLISRSWSSVGASSQTCGASVIPSARSSTTRRQQRSRNPRTPPTPAVLQGFVASSGPMNIS